MALPKVAGAGRAVTLSTGRQARVVQLNNAATTPPFERTLKEVNDFLLAYGALQRGAGPNAEETFKKVVEAIAFIRKFFNLGDGHALLFTQHTTSAVNLFVRTLGLRRHDVVLTSPIEHTSNNLPWRFNTSARVIEAEAFPDGSIDYGDLESKAEKFSRCLKVIAVNGASNTSGCLPDFKRLGEIASRHGALLFLDAAQLAPKRPIDMRGYGIDAFALSAHKIYAPFGCGALVLPRQLLGGHPADPGGGSVEMVSDPDIGWMKVPEYRHQSGTWNSTGIIALAASLKAIDETGWEEVVNYERELTAYAAKRFIAFGGGLKLHVEARKYMEEDRVGNFPFNLEGYHHMHLSAILGHEYGIETRAGAICNHRLVRRWFGVSDTEQRRVEDEIAGGNRLASYGIVRASLGLQNTRDDIDALFEALSEISERGPALRYRAIPEEEAYVPI